MSILIHFPGFYGIASGAVIFLVLWAFCYCSLGPGPFEMDPKGEKGAFLPIFDIYKDVAKLVIGLASATIAALIGTAILHEKPEAEPLSTSFASPLNLLALCILCGVFFLVFLARDYEAYRHGTKEYTRSKYSINLSLSYSCLSCFVAGYFGLIHAVITGAAVTSK